MIAYLKSRVQAWSARAGYPILPAWRLSRYDQSTHLRDLFRALRIDCVLDVGANIGQYYEFLRVHVGYRGRVISFEPVPELFDRLVAASRKDPLWTVFPLALGDSEADAELHVLQENTLTSFLPRDEAALKEMGYDKYLRETTLARDERVAVRRLDRIFEEVLAEPGARVFLKSDTQGYDMKVIRGAAACLHRIAGLQIELSVRHVYQGAPHYLHAVAELNALGFEETGLYAVQRDSALRIVNIDCTMIRADEARRLRADRPGSGN